MKLNKINSSVIEVNVIDIGHPTLLTNVLVVWWLVDCQDVRKSLRFISRIILIISKLCGTEYMYLCI